jgi:hypothetical protein
VTVRRHSAVSEVEAAVVSLDEWVEEIESASAEAVLV